MEPAGLVLSRFAAFAALLLVAGLPLHALTLTPLGPMSPRRRMALAVLATIAAGASAWWALESVAAMVALPLAKLDQATFIAVLAATPLGAVMEWRLTALAAVVLAMVLPLWATRSAVAALAGAAALATMAWTGHAGASEGGNGTLYRFADVVHLLAAGTWLGALAGFTVQAFGRDAARQTHALAAFARTGSVIVALLLLTGIVNTLAITGWPLPLGSRWTLLLALKLTLFSAMLGLAAVNRWKITPALARGDAAGPLHLKRSLVLEMALGLGVVGVVALLGVLDPAA